MLAAPGLASSSDKCFDDSAEREPIVYQRGVRSARGGSDVDASLPGGGLKTRSSSHRTTSSSSLSTTAGATDAASASSSLSSDSYMRMVDELVARGGCSDSKAGNDDDVYFFQHSSPTADPPYSGRLTPRQLYLQSGNGLVEHMPAIQALEQLNQPAQKPDKGKRSAAAAEAVAEPERERLRLNAQQDAEMDRLDSALARHHHPRAEPARRALGSRSAAVDVPGAAAGKAAAATLFTASSPAMESPFGSASSVRTSDSHCLACLTRATFVPHVTRATCPPCHTSDLSCMLVQCCGTYYGTW